MAQEEKDRPRIYEGYIEGEKPGKMETLSGLPLKETYTPGDIQDFDYQRDLGNPGDYPFTRGVHRTMYRGRLWTRRQIVGFGGPKETNQRIRFLFQEGQTGLNLVPDLPNEHGFDPDHPMAEGEVGVVGVSASTLPEMEEVFSDIPLEKVSVTMITRPPTAPVWLAMLLIMASRRGFPEEKLMGTVQNDPIFQMSGGTAQTVVQFFPLSLSMKLCVDVIEYCARHLPRMNTPCINGYNMRETGINAVQEVAFTLSMGMEIIRQTLARGLSIDEFAPRISFFVSSHIDFLEEIAKFRAFRRMWARIMKEKFQARDPLSMRFRFSCQTAGSSLTTQQPLNNIIRTTSEVMAAVLGGAQAVQATAYDEGISLPTEEAHRLVLRTSQIIGYETGIGKTVDPMGGSYCIEKLTNQIEERAWDTIQKMEERGGMLAVFRDGWIEQQIIEARLKNFEEIEKGERTIIGINRFAVEEAPHLKFHRTSPDWEKERIDYIKEFREKRDREKTERVLGKVARAIRDKENMISVIKEAVVAEATLGEISQVMRDAGEIL